MLKLLVPQLKPFCTKNKIVLRHERKDSIVRTNCICGPSLYHMVHGTSVEWIMDMSETRLYAMKSIGFYISGCINILT